MVSGIIGTSPGIIVGHPNFVKKVVFPLEILPAAMVGALAYDLIIGIALCLVGILIVGSEISVSIIFLPLILAPVFLIAMGLSWFFSALGVFVRDVGQLSSFLGLALLYSSGVFYSAEKVQKTAPLIWNFLQWNPLLQIIDSLREVVLWQGNPNWGSIAYAWCFGILMLFLGSWFFNRLKPAFADIL